MPNAKTQRRTLHTYIPILSIRRPYNSIGFFFFFFFSFFLAFQLRFPHRIHSVGGEVCVLCITYFSSSFRCFLSISRMAMPLHVSHRARAYVFSHHCTNAGRNMPNLLFIMYIIVHWASLLNGKYHGGGYCRWRQMRSNVEHGSIQQLLDLL